MPPTLGIIRDDRFLNHKTGLSHPESPGRLLTLHRLLDYEPPPGVLEMAARPCTLEALERVHEPAYVRLILASAQRGFTQLAADTTVSEGSCLAAWLAAGACMAAVDALMAGELAQVLALVRPPGHHAMPAAAGGFCVFNNLAVAARHAQAAHGLKRILVVDWDLHHGNALEKVFYDDPGVLYLSSHHLNTWPHTGPPESVGGGEGEGYTINLCLPGGAADGDVLHLYREILPQVVERYRPQMVMVACGFDAHHADPLGIFAMTELGFAGLAELVRVLAPQERGLPLLLSLEGGYDPAALAQCLERVIAVLAANEATQLGLAESQRAADLADRTRRLHARYRVWTG